MDLSSLAPEILSSVEVKLLVSLISEIMLIEGRIAYRAKGECARCLAPIEALVESDFKTQIDLAAGTLHALDLELDEDESEGGFSRLDETRIDLSGEIASRVLQSIPERFLCREDCPGISYDGAGNAGEKESPSGDTRSKNPFAALETLLGDKK